MTQLKKRDEIDPQYTWNAPSVFASAQAWDQALANALAQLPQLTACKGALAEGADTLLAALEKQEEIWRDTWKILVYASMSHSVDTGDQAAKEMYSRAQGFLGQVSAAASFIEPELIEIGEAAIKEWMAQSTELATYAHYFDDLFRNQAHVRSAEVEELLGMLSPVMAGPSNTAQALTNADFRFAPALSQEGKEVVVAQGTLDGILARGDRQARRTAWENYMDAYLTHKNTLAANLENSLVQNAFQTRARHHDSTLTAALFAGNIPTEVFHNLISTFKKNLPTWHRYWAIRRKALGVETLHPYDIWAPLTDAPPEIPYPQAVEWICEGLAPLGPDYVATVRRGCLEERWVDLYPNEGKRDGAFSSGAPGTHPFILMSYTDDIGSLSTLAQELGHSMHSYLTWQPQPFAYCQYDLFVAEVASNFSQALVRSHLIARSDNPAFEIGIIEEAMANFHRYFFIMPTLARFELEIHERVERGQGLTADAMIELMADLFAEGYGDQMHIDHERVGMTWATFGHLYVDYYVYQYATGLSGAYALLKRITSGQAGAVDDYLGFLKTGSAQYGLEALKGAGIDLSSPEPVEETFAMLAGWVDRLEALVGD